jgi:hypothetical protein
MLAALASPPNSAAQINSWAAVNAQFAKNIPYLFLDIVVTAYAAAKKVQNFATSTAGDGVTRALVIGGEFGALRWDQIWVS